MKKGLLIIASLIVSFSISAQLVQENWIVADSTESVAYVEIAPSKGFKSGGEDNYGYDYAGWSGRNVISWTGDALKIVNTGANGDNWDGVEVYAFDWNGTDGDHKFTKAIDGTDNATFNWAVGYTVDMTNDDNKVVEFSYKAEDDLMLRVDLKDLNGKVTNHLQIEFNLEASTAWTSVKLSWGDDDFADYSTDAMIDKYSPNLWGRDVTARGDEEWDLDASKIAGIIFLVDPGPASNHTLVKTIEIKDIVLGCKSCVSNAEVVAEATVEVIGGVVYSAGTISVLNVLGQEVASAEGELSIAELPAGVYVIVTEEGVAKIVK